MRRYLTSRPFYPIVTAVQTSVLVSDTPAGVPSTWIPGNATGAFISCDTLGGGVKFAFGTDPNTLWGIDLAPGDIFTIHDSPEMLASIRFVRISATSGRVSIIPFMDA